MSDENGSGTDTGEVDWGDALAEQRAADGVPGGDGDGEFPAATAVGAELSELAEAEDGEEIMHDGSLDVILDIPVLMSLEVGRTEISIRQLLQLKQGSVIELDRLAGDPLDVLVNGTLVAHGEVVVVNEKYGIRLTDVLSPKERIKQLR